MPFDPPVVTLRPIRPDDIPALAAMLARPEVARWWPGYDDRARVEAEFLGQEPDLTIYAIEVGARLAGSIQSFEEPEADFRHANIDLFVDPDLHGQGIGSAAIRSLAARLIDENGHHRLTIDPAADNDVAIRVYERVGFRPVGRMRQYQRMADGSWADGLLMELLAHELVR
ncbi:MAG: aminoglycoside 6-N-acetyltransferase [Chloroflexota bacterium]|nr:aminoglycoside 6-N-acetyltransferase [Chloroflexota bacterium]MEA2613098.1 aminoglycoside 6-N-acetyltransferase [Chloroflexota bacterium]